MNENCPICNSPTNYNKPDGSRDAFLIDCFRCGNFSITGSAKAFCYKPFGSPLQIANVSGWIREHQKELFSDDLEKLMQFRTPNVAEKAIKLLKYLSKRYPIAGAEIMIDLGAADSLLTLIREDNFSIDLDDTSTENARKFLPLFSASWTQNSKELSFILYDYLYRGQKYLHFEENNKKLAKITPDGWVFLQSLRTSNPESQTAFIAMSLAPELDYLFDDFIDKAILNSGYQPIRIDKHEHANRIDDEIIALIRQSKFVVADFTGQRGGVYFESGFALGLGLPVIWLCKRDDEDNLHFDTNHYNFIFWEKGKESQLQESLQRRIEAVITKGNYTVNA